MTKDELAAIRDRTRKADNLISCIEGVGTAIDKLRDFPSEEICITKSGILTVGNYTCRTARVNGKNMVNVLIEVLVNHRQQLEKELSEL